MKSLKCSLILLLFSMYLNAEVKILSVIQRSSTDPQSGSILVEAKDGCYPYKIICEGRFTNKRLEKTQVNGQHKFIQLMPDFYNITIINSYGCIFNFNDIEIRDCLPFELNLTIRDVCNGVKGYVTAESKGGISPYSYKWFDSKDNLIGTGGSISDLNTGDYSVIAYDNVGCQSKKIFKINSVTISIDTKAQFYCYDKSSVIVNVNPVAAKFIYVWNDGKSYETGSSSIRNDLPYGYNYQIKVYNASKTCSDIEFGSTSKKEDIPLYPFFKTPILKHPSTEFSTDGSIDIWYNAYFKNMKVDIFLNGSFISNLSCENNSRNKLFGNLGVGFYRFDFYDDKGCLMNSVYAELISCTLNPGKANIKIIDYNLPPGSQGAYVKASATYQGGDISKCKYRWYINPYYDAFTNIPELNQPDIDHLAWTPEDNKIHVDMICPCGKASTFSVFDPCHPDARIVYKNSDRITNLCEGTLHTGEYKYIRNHGHIKLEIDLTRYFIRNTSLGLSDLDYYVKDLYWDDGEPINYHYSNKTLFIDRDIFSQGYYAITIASGVGCLFHDEFFVDNTFESNFDPIKCVSSIECTDDSRTRVDVNDLKLEMIDAHTCEAQLLCEGNIIAQFNGIQGDLHSATQYEEQSSGNCFNINECYFDVADFTLDLQKQAFPITIEKHELILGSKKEYYKVIEYSASLKCHDCMFEDAKNDEQSIYSRLKHIDNFFYFKTDADEPCIAMLFCKNDPFAYRIIHGKGTAQPVCKNGTKCVQKYVCTYTIDKVDFTGDSNHPDLNTEKIVDISKCNNASSCFIDVVSRAISNFQMPKFEISPNPFDQIITIKSLSEIDGNIKVKCYNSCSQELIEFEENLEPKSNYSKIIDLENLPAGVYYIKITINNLLVQITKIVKA